MSAYTVSPEIDTNLEQNSDVTLISPSSVTLREWTALSYSTNSASFSMPPPNTQVFMSRCMLFKMPFTITLTGTSTGAIFEPGKIALRAFPLASISAVDTLTLNNAQFTILPNEFIPPMARFWDLKDFTGFPAMLDAFRQYSDGVGGISNPLGTYYNAVGSNSASVPRGAFPMVIVNNSTTSSVITGDIYEPILLPMLRARMDKSLGFSNIKTCDFNRTFASNLARILSTATLTATLSSVSVALGRPSLIVKYSSPMAGYVPRTLTYNSENIERFITPLGVSVANGVSDSIQSTNINLSCVPKWILLFIRESNLYNNSSAIASMGTSDVAMTIEGVSISFNNVSGILSTATTNSLYLISQSNGLKDTWEQYNGFTSVSDTKVGLSGSFLKLFYGKDILLQEGTRVGQIGQYNMTVKVNYKNNSGVTFNQPELYMITSTHQKLVIHENSVIDVEVGIPALTQEAKYVPFDDNLVEFYGGSFKDFISKVWNGIKKVNTWLKDKKVVSTIGNALGSVGVPFAKQIATTADKFGYGMQEDAEDEAGVIVGGKIASRAQLLRKMKNMKR